jgi:hypothetical protein
VRGSINAVVPAYGLSVGGREGAKKALSLFLATDVGDGGIEHLSAVHF